MENSTDRIDRYLDGKMDATEKASFEQEMQRDSNLQQQVEVQRNLRGGIERLGMKSTIATTFRKMTVKNKIYKWGAVTVAITAIGAATYFGAQQFSNAPGERKITYELPALNENGKAEWANADRNLPTQLFEIDPDKDTVIETQNGIVFAIPAGAFVDAKDPVTLEIREALNAFDIMKGGLSTTSDGQPLETGGMFYLNARNGETNLRINAAKPVYANVPTNEVLPGMQLYEGERTDDGGINWKNPKPLEKQLIPVDIRSLDFYPQGFREEVAQLGFDANNKSVTDSIYYSYAGRYRSTVVGEKTSIDSARVRHILIAYKGAERAAEVTRTEGQAKQLADSLRNVIASGKARMEDLVYRFTDDPGSKSGNLGDYGWFTEESGFVQAFKDAGFNNRVGETVVVKTDFGYHVIQVLAQTSPTTKFMQADGQFSYTNTQPEIGERLFKSNCASCHYATEKRGTGPGLQGVLSRIPGSDWAHNFVHNSSKVIASGDAYAVNLFNAYHGTQMTAFPALKNEEIDAILNYTNNGGKVGDEINPSRIAAIRDPKFNNTLLATKEFEERLQVIFKYGQPNLLDLYVNNLNKKMYEIDSMAYATSHIPEFYNFSLRKDGGVSISQPHLKELQSFYERKKKAVDLAAQKTFADRQSKERANDQAHARLQQDYSARHDAQYVANLNKEFEINLKEAYRQLGVEAIQPPAKNYYNTTITTPGWKNIDRAVMEATVNRETLDYTDSLSGKKAVIQYATFNVSVANAASYDQLSVYLVANWLPSFMKLSGSNGSYSEKLNALMSYSLVVIGQKGKQWSYVKQDAYRDNPMTVQLAPVAESQLRSDLDAVFGKNIGHDFGEELNAMIETQQYYMLLQERKKQQEIDAALLPIIFPQGHEVPLPEPGAHYDPDAQPAFSSQK